MSALAQFAQTHAAVFTLVLRVGGIVVIGPFFASNGVPAQVRAMLVLAVSLLITPIALSSPPPEIGGVGEFLLIAAGETLVGLALGTGVMLTLTGIQLAGNLIGTVGGLQVADLFNPGLNANMPLFSQVLYQMALAIFLVIGGHRVVLDGLLSTFAVLPLGTATVSDGISGTLIAILSQSYDLGIRIAAPTIVALIMSTLVLGLVGRTLPQLNFLTFGFGANVAVLLGMVALSVGAMGWLMQAHLEPMLQTIIEQVPAPRGLGLF